MENHVHSSLVCAARLLRLAGLNSEAVEDFSRKAVIDRFTMATQASLQRYLSQFSRATVARFKVKKQSLNKIKPEHLPLAFRDM